MEDYGIKVTISGDDSDLQNKISSSIAGLSSFGEAFETMNRETKESFADLANQFTAIDSKAKVWGGDIDSVSEKKKALRDEINRLIDSGITPESKQIQDLKKAYDNLSDAQDKNKEKSKTLGDSFASLRDIMQGPIAAFVMLKDGLKDVFDATVGKASAIEDITAAFTPLTGSVESAKKMITALNTEAATTPFTLQEISGVAKQLLPVFGNDVEAVTKQFRMLGDTAGGNIQNLDSITRGYVKVLNTGKVSLEALNMISDAGVPIQTQLAKSMGLVDDATGSATAQLLKMVSAGQVSKEELTKAFEAMTSSGGLFFEGMKTSSDTMSAWKAGMSDALDAAGAAIGEQFLPFVKDLYKNTALSAQAFTSWAKENDNLKKTLETLAIIVSSAGGAIAVFAITANISTIVSAVTGAVTGLATAFKALTVAIASNPIGAIAALITAVLIPAIILLVKNWDTVTDAFKTGFAYITYGVEIAAGKISSVFIIAFNTVKSAMLTFAQVYADTILAAISNLLKLASNIPGIGNAFKTAANGVDNFKASIDKAIQSSKDDSAQAIKTAEQANTAAKNRLNNTLQAIENEKTFREDAKNKEIEGQKETVVNSEKTETKKQEQTASTVKYQDEQNAKALQSYINSLNKEEAAAIATAKSKEESVESVVAIAKDYDDKELAAYTEMIESQRKVALAEAAKKKADANTIANINKQYNDKITTYEQSQLSAREKLNTDYTKDLETKAKERQEFELKWAKQTTDDKQKQLDLQYAADVAKAKQLITDKTELAATLLAIDKQYTEDSNKIYSSQDSVWTNLVKSIKNTWTDMIDELKKKSSDWSDTVKTIANTLSGAVKDSLVELGEQLATGTLNWASFGKIALEALASVLQGIGGQLAGLAVVHTLMGDLVGAAAAAAGSTAAYIASGAVTALAGQLAEGTDYTKMSGDYLVGEQGPEIVSLPQGSQVVTNNNTRELLNDNRTTGNTYNIYAGQSLSAAEIAREVKKTNRSLGVGIVA